MKYGGWGIDLLHDRKKNIPLCPLKCPLGPLLWRMYVCLDRTFLLHPNVAYIPVYTSFLYYISYCIMQEELYHEGSSPLHRPDHGGGIPVYPPNLHPWSPGVVSDMLL